MIHVVTEGVDGPSGFGTALGRALLLRASAGEVGETFVIHVPGREVAFGKHDTLTPGYAAATAAARAAGFAAIERLAGGRAAVFHEGTLAFTWTVPDPSPTAGIHRRFRQITDLLGDAFARLGIAAAVGEVPGEYCPGAYSMSVADRKVVGVGQRLTRHAAHIGGVVVVTDANLVNRVLIPVYAHLGIAWDPTTTGALDRTAASPTITAVRDAIVASLAAARPTRHGPIDAVTLDLAGRLVAAHRAP